MDFIEFDNSFDFFVKKCSFICILLKKQCNSVFWLVKCYPGATVLFSFLKIFPQEREIELKYPHLAQITKSLSFPYFIAISLPVQFFLDQSSCRMARKSLPNVSQFCFYFVLFFHLTKPYSLGYLAKTLVIV